jgi:hypothetical protein
MHPHSVTAIGTTIAIQRTAAVGLLASAELAGCAEAPGVSAVAIEPASQHLVPAGGAARSFGSRQLQPLHHQPSPACGQSLG